MMGDRGWPFYRYLEYRWHSGIFWIKRAQQSERKSWHSLNTPFNWLVGTSRSRQLLCGYKRQVFVPAQYVRKSNAGQGIEVHHCQRPPNQPSGSVPYSCYRHDQLFSTWESSFPSSVQEPLPELSVSERQMFRVEESASACLLLSLVANEDTAVCQAACDATMVKPHATLRRNLTS